MFFKYLNNVKYRDDIIFIMNALYYLFGHIESVIDCILVHVQFVHIVIHVQTFVYVQIGIHDYRLLFNCCISL